MKRIFFLLMIAGLAVPGQAQRRYEQVLQLVEEHCPMLQAARQHCDAAQMQAQVGLLLPDPEVELSLFRGDPADQGTRWDLRVTQSFEMPSVYVRRARLRALAQKAAELDYQTVHNALMHETQQLCAELVYAQGIAGVYSRCAAAAAQLEVMYEKSMAQGACSALEYNRARMEAVSLKDKASRAALHVHELYNDLGKMTGTALVNVRLEEYDTVILPKDFDGWYDTLEMGNPQLRALQNEMERSRQELQLNRAKWLPEMSLGYVSETVTGSAFRGVALGMTLPLWSQPRAVRQAHLAYAAANQELEAQRQATGNEMRGRWERLVLLQGNLEEMRQGYAENNSRDLLDKALMAGEITLEQYLIQTDYYLQQELTLWEIAYELERGYIDLYAFTL